MQTAEKPERAGEEVREDDTLGSAKKRTKTGKSTAKKKKKCADKRKCDAESGEKSSERRAQETSSTDAGSPEGMNQKLGKIGEEMACHYLKNNDIEIIERNWKCRNGEADIIACEDDTLVFIEVKTRSKGYPGLPEYAVTAQKRARYEKIAVVELKNKMEKEHIV